MFKLDITPEVQSALDENRPVVALESTIITHGMPWPQNYDMAVSVEQVIRDAGAVPATIAVLKGQIKIGLADADLRDLAQTPDARKLSRADLAICMVQGATGATTVAATMILAHLAGIKTFATGGIGGVHRGAEHSFDISADLQELAQTPVTVVAAGAKAILDIPKTLEVLETLGVPVITYGQSELPAFWSRTSGLVSPLRMDTAKDIAQAHIMRGALNIQGGQLIANPVPHADEIPQSDIDPIIAQAIQEAEDQKISAKAVTPFLLGRIFELTQGRSLKTNISLVLNNARLAAEIAKEMSDL
ncbi:MAG: pseudouridine-5'-phosphate glycosidase [Rhodobacteraceae bacterium]|nr:pseudouridine-5'-phosphate glycosidase [Paracoccaceae bacterium]